MQSGSLMCWTQITELTGCDALTISCPTIYVKDTTVVMLYIVKGKTYFTR